MDRYRHHNAYPSKPRTGQREKGAFFFSLKSPPQLLPCPIRSVNTRQGAGLGGIGGGGDRGLGGVGGGGRVGEDRGSGDGGDGGEGKGGGSGGLGCQELQPSYKGTCDPIPTAYVPPHPPFKVTLVVPASLTGMRRLLQHLCSSEGERSQGRSSTRAPSAMATTSALQLRQTLTELCAHLIPVFNPSGGERDVAQGVASWLTARNIPFSYDSSWGIFFEVATTTVSPTAASVRDASASSSGDTHVLSSARTVVLSAHLDSDELEEDALQTITVDSAASATTQGGTQFLRHGGKVGLDCKLGVVMCLAVAEAVLSGSVNLAPRAGIAGSASVRTLRVLLTVGQEVGQRGALRMPRHVLKRLADDGAVALALVRKTSYGDEKGNDGKPLRHAVSEYCGVDLVPLDVAGRLRESLTAAARRAGISYGAVPFATSRNCSDVLELRVRHDCEVLAPFLLAQPDVPATLRRHLLAAVKTYTDATAQWTAMVATVEAADPTARAGSFKRAPRSLRYDAVRMVAAVLQRDTTQAAAENHGTGAPPKLNKKDPATYVGCMDADRFIRDALALPGAPRQFAALNMSYDYEESRGSVDVAELEQTCGLVIALAEELASGGAAHKGRATALATEETTPTWSNLLGPAPRHELVGVRYLDSDGDLVDLKLAGVDGIGEGGKRRLEKWLVCDDGTSRLLRTATFLKFNPLSGMLVDDSGWGARVLPDMRLSLKLICEAGNCIWWEGLVLPIPEGPAALRLPRILFTSNGLINAKQGEEFERLLRLRQSGGRKAVNFVYIPDAAKGLSTKKDLTHIFGPGFTCPDTSMLTCSVPGPEKERQRALGRFKSSIVVPLTSLCPWASDYGFDETDRAASLATLSKADVIWVGGGSVPRLMKAIRGSGAVSSEGQYWLYQLLSQGVVYAGVSAGAIVAGESLEPMFWKGRLEVGGNDKEQIDNAADHQQAIQNLTGMRLVGQFNRMSFHPHANGHEEAMTIWERGLDHQYAALYDQGGAAEARALVVEGADHRFV